MDGQTIVVALGGNAILQPGERGTYEQQAANVNAAAARIADTVERGMRVVVTHGNGPQVGNILIQEAAAADVVEQMPMFVAGAKTQGQLGFMIEQSLLNELDARGLDVPLSTVLTEVEVDGDDPAFTKPTKPVGPFYTAKQAEQLAAENGWRMREDAGRGWRRVVASPRPRRIVSLPAIATLLHAGHIVIACGGGGIPVTRAPHGGLHGVDAVVDKDLAAARLAMDLGADVLAILTEVPNVYVDFGTPKQRPLWLVDTDEIDELAAAGQFAEGSMGPKVRAASEFVRAGGASAIIAKLDQLGAALDEKAGTHIAAGRTTTAGHQSNGRAYLVAEPAIA
jgi:carbamate kinase